MNNPIKKYYSDNHVEIYAWGAAPYIKEALRLDADVWVTTNYYPFERVLSHNAAMRPVGKLPWPLSKIQAHNVRLTITLDETWQKVSNDKRHVDLIYKWDDVDRAIANFLTEVRSEEIITIQVK